ncbi:MAG: [Fe-Fe] hydrogenase large subunit C-terminal domain-containing protein [Patescibacteria group bacterium]
MINIKINNKKYTAKEGETILDVCRRSKIRIPTLCNFDGLPKEQVCRLCLVETNRSEKLLTSCGMKVCEGLEVRTESEKIAKARRINLELLWADHAGKCATCKKNRQCELQDLAEEYGIENFHFIPRREEITGAEELDLLLDNKKRYLVDENNPCISKRAEFCVECRRCVSVCPTQEFGFNFRSGDVKVSTPYGQPLDCIFCGKCVAVCPTASLTEKTDEEAALKELEDLNILSVAMIDPFLLGKFGSVFPELDSREKFFGFLRELGFEKIFLLDPAIGEAGERLGREIEKKERKFLLGGNCPSFVLFVKKYFPELLKFISETNSADEIMAKWLKNDWAKKEKIDQENIRTISITNCIAKKALTGKELSGTLTLRELSRLARRKKIDLGSIAKSKADKFLFSSPDDIASEKDIIRIALKGKKMKKIDTRGAKNFREVLENIQRGKIEADFYEFWSCE